MALQHCKMFMYFPQKKRLNVSFFIIVYYCNQIGNISRATQHKKQRFFLFNM